MKHHPDCPCSDEGCSSVGGYDKHHDASPGDCRCGQKCCCERLERAARRAAGELLLSVTPPLEEQGWAEAAYEQGKADERDRIRRFIIGLTTTEHTRHLIDTILWYIGKGDSDESL
jgi:hypothetical protein